MNSIKKVIMSKKLSQDWNTKVKVMFWQTCPLMLDQFNSQNLFRPLSKMTSKAWLLKSLIQIIVLRSKQDALEMQLIFLMMHRAIKLSLWKISFKKNLSIKTIRGL